ncbi:helix-turn-helix domain-containing protein [Actinoalloteichus caeruleus]|uniref:helix-turn-helix domain-containing protein n=1 Tax=Actinoalloteichus cyanogriseus TaxID=2893586 RepID=UPI003AAF03F4
MVERHIGHLIRAYRRAHDPPVPQARVAQWIGVTQGQLSRIERGSASKDLDRLERWAYQLRIPEALMWFSYADNALSVSKNGHTIKLDSERGHGEEEDMDRRSFITGLTAVASTGVASSPWSRVAETAASKRPADARTIDLVTSRTRDFYRTEEHTPSRQLLSGLQSHRKLILTLIDNTTREGDRSRLISTLGETDALAGWALFDVGQTERAVRAIRTALNAADQASDGPLAACALNYWSYLASAQGEKRFALTLLSRASDRVKGAGAPTTHAWVAARTAEESAALNGGPTAMRALDRAWTAYEYASPLSERPWTGFFTESRLGSIVIATHNQIGSSEAESLTREVLSAMSPSENKVRALVLSHLARSAARSADYDRACHLARAARTLAIRTEASLARAQIQELRAVLPPRLAAEFAGV